MLKSWDGVPSLQATPAPLGVCGLCQPLDLSVLGSLHLEEQSGGLPGGGLFSPSESVLPTFRLSLCSSHGLCSLFFI